MKKIIVATLIQLCCLMLAGISCYAQDSGNVGKPSFDKVLHSFSVQYNNYIHFPAHFDYHCAPLSGGNPFHTTETNTRWGMN